MNTLACIGVILMLTTCAAAKSLPLPSYLIGCSRHENDMNACVTKSGKAAIPFIVKGDKRYKIPVLDPLHIPMLHVDEGVLGLNFTATNLILKGLKNTIVNSIRWDTKHKTGTYNLMIPRVDIDADYVVGGQILILPITGKGRANITMLNVATKYVFEFDFVKKEDGETYVIPSRGEMTIDTTRLYIYLDNLFNGNKLLGDEMNRFMDENWREMVKELAPVVGQAMGEVMRRIQKNVFELVDYDHAFPDVPVS